MLLGGRDGRQKWVTGLEYQGVSVIVMDASPPLITSG